MSPCMKWAMLDQLADYFNSWLAAYPTTLADDESMIMIVDFRLSLKPQTLARLIWIWEIMSVFLMSRLQRITTSPLGKIYQVILNLCRLLRLCGNCPFKWPLLDSTREKLSQFRHVPINNILNIHDVPNIWHIPLLLRVSV
ncbi:uncharacterized protein LOC131662232 [Vicia villosa]|uniref:uncharacterized protein LOC131662232 n=1 Tax=Vicia villosa TaxID=3911 RepID=UPI00273C112F|nr:uncharacterized protein LOC131662232 [Vicia villosa]